MPLPHIPQGMMSMFTLPSIKPEGWEWKMEHVALGDSGLLAPKDVLVCPKCLVEENKPKPPVLKVVGGSGDKNSEP